MKLWLTKRRWLLLLSTLSLLVAFIAFMATSMNEPTVDEMRALVLADRLPPSALDVAIAGVKSADYRVKSRAVLVLARIAENGEPLQRQRARLELKMIEVEDPDPNIRNLASTLNRQKKTKEEHE